MSQIKLTFVFLLSFANWQNPDLELNQGKQEVYIALFTGATGSAATGIPAIANKLSSLPNTVVKVYAHSETETAKNDIQKRIKITGNEQVILIGHSMGGNAVLNFVATWGNSYNFIRKEPDSRPFEPEQILIDYVITIDPVGLNSKLNWNIPGYNFYTTFGEDIAGDLIHGKLISGKNMTNNNLTTRNHNCSQGNPHRYTHTNIDDCEEIIENIFRLVKGRIHIWEF